MHALRIHCAWHCAGANINSFKALVVEGGNGTLISVSRTAIIKVCSSNEVPHESQVHALYIYYESPVDTPFGGSSARETHGETDPYNLAPCSAVGAVKSSMEP